MKLTKLILIAFCVTASLAGAQFAAAQAPENRAPFCQQGRPNLTAMLTHMLQLTDAQKTQVDPLVAAVRPQLDAIHQKARAEAEVVLKQLDDQIRPLLTPDQQKRLDAMELLHATGAHGSE
jgi:hypothetical protein